MREEEWEVLVATEACVLEEPRRAWSTARIGQSFHVPRTGAHAVDKDQAAKV
jgi:hypothetical protein